MPVNALIIRALLHYYLYYGDEFTVECPTGSGRQMTLYQVAEEITRRLSAMFLRGPDGRRPVFGGNRTFQEDPHWRDCLLFYEYFHGDSGRGVGASHQTGWTGLVAKLLLPRYARAVVEPRQAPGEARESAPPAAPPPLPKKARPRAARISTSR